MTDENTRHLLIYNDTACISMNQPLATTLYPFYAPCRNDRNFLTRKVRSTRSNSTAGTFKVHVHSRMNLKSSTGPSRKAIKQAVKNMQTTRSSSRHSTYHHPKAKHVVHQGPLPRPSLCCVRERRLPWLQLCHWQPAEFG